MSLAMALRRRLAPRDGCHGAVRDDRAARDQNAPQEKPSTRVSISMMLRRLAQKNAPRKAACSVRDDCVALDPCAPRDPNAPLELEEEAPLELEEEACSVRENCIALEEGSVRDDYVAPCATTANKLSRSEHAPRCSVRDDCGLLDRSLFRKPIQSSIYPRSERSSQRHTNAPHSGMPVRDGCVALRSELAPKACSVHALCDRGVLDQSRFRLELAPKACSVHALCDRSVLDQSLFERALSTSFSTSLSNEPQAFQRACSTSTFGTPLTSRGDGDSRVALEQNAPRDTDDRAERIGTEST